MSSITPRNRDFTNPPDQHSQVFIRGWSDTATNTGIPATTGLWRPIQLDVSGNLQTAAQPSAATYHSYVTGTTGGQLLIPVGAYNWSILVQSGTAYLGDFPLFAANQSPLFGGNLGIGAKSNTALVVGLTGGRLLVTYDL